MSGPTFDRTATQSSTWTELPSAVRSLWDTCMQNQGGTDVARALTTNFIGIAEAGNAASLRDATELLQRRSPCRAFLLLIDDDGAKGSANRDTAELSATTRCHGSIRDIVLEEIVLRLRPEDLPRVPGLLRPLIMDDLPSHLFWSLPWPADESPFDSLANLCEHAIVDSRTFGNPARELLVIKRRCEQGQRITDLSWLRVQPWRRALAEAFERFQWQPGTTVKGLVRHGKSARASAMLLSEWLHERLSAAITMEPDGSPNSIGPDHVSLQIDNIEIVIDLDNDKLVTHVSTASHCYLPFTASATLGNPAELLSIALNQP